MASLPLVRPVCLVIRLSNISRSSLLCPAICSPLPQCTSVRTSLTWIKFQRWQDAVKEAEQWEKEKGVVRRQMRGKYYIEAEDIGEEYRKTKHPEDITRRDSGGISFDYFAFQSGMRYLDLDKKAIRRYREYQKFLARQFDQRFIAERLLVLGPDLAAAHFLVHRGASVKFVGHDKWIKREVGRFGSFSYDLPDQNIPGMYLEAVDASGTELMFEAFDNMINLSHLRMLRLADCPHIDDWCLSKFSQFERSLEMLDLSGCTKISHRGLTALAHLRKLQHLRLERLDSVKNIAKTSLMLEESTPELRISGIDYEAAANQLDDSVQLASHSRVVEDARGNLHAFDDAGQMYCVGGESIDNINTRPCVDDVDRPMMKSTIKRDVPLMSLQELIELDKLSQRRLRRLLLGSPSSVHWNADVELLVSFNASRRLARGAEVHPFMTPGTLIDDQQKKLPPGDGQTVNVDGTVQQQKLTSATDSQRNSKKPTTLSTVMGKMLPSTSS